ncbi:DUF2929 family protein [Pediococcus acidilactici]
MMKQIVVIFWAFIFGEVLGYIGGALEVLPYSSPLKSGRYVLTIHLKSPAGEKWLLKKRIFD